MERADHACAMRGREDERTCHEKEIEDVVLGCSRRILLLAVPVRIPGQYIDARAGWVRRFSRIERFMVSF